MRKIVRKADSEIQTQGECEVGRTAADWIKLRFGRKKGSELSVTERLQHTHTLVFSLRRSRENFIDRTLHTHIHTHTPVKIEH